MSETSKDNLKNFVNNEEYPSFDQDNNLKANHDSNILTEKEKNEIFIKTGFEMIATFFFILLIYLCQKDISKFIFGMWIILVFFGKFSGAHLNPAITLGFYVHKGNYKKNLFELIMFLIAQFVGCILGVICSNFLMGQIIYIEIPMQKNIFQIIFSELFFTGTFFFIILFCCEVTAPSKKSYINCIFIVSWFYVIVNAGAFISGAAFNPAVLSVMNLFAFLYNIDDAQFSMVRLLMMIIGQLVGVTIFALIYKYLFFKYYLFIKKIQDEKKKIKQTRVYA